jgi:hypothetical protein
MASKPYSNPPRVNTLDVQVRDAVLGNVGTIISFRLGLPDAEFLAGEFYPFFSASDLINLPNYHIYLKLMIDGKVSPPFSGETSKSMAALRYASELTLSLGINKSIGYQGWIMPPRSQKLTNRTPLRQLVAMVRLPVNTFPASPRYNFSPESTRRHMPGSVL